MFASTAGPTIVVLISRVRLLASPSDIKLLERFALVYSLLTKRPNKLRAKPNKLGANPEYGFVFICTLTPQGREAVLKGNYQYG